MLLAAAAAPSAAQLPLASSLLASSTRDVHHSSSPGRSRWTHLHAGLHAAAAASLLRQAADRATTAILLGANQTAATASAGKAKGLCNPPRGVVDLGDPMLGLGAAAAASTSLPVLLCDHTRVV